MPTLTFPDITPNAVDWGLQPNTQNTRSELDGTVQTLALPGDVWSGVLTFSNKFDPEARILRAFLSSLRGQAGRFYLSPPGYRQAGTAPGSPIVKGASQTGLALATDGWTPSQTGILLAGDYFEVNGELKIMTADADSDSGGNATLNFTPPLRTSPADNAAITTTDPKVTMMLKDANQARWQAQPTPIYALSIAVQEALA